MQSTKVMYIMCAMGMQKLQYLCTSSFCNVQLAQAPLEIFHKLLSNQDAPCQYRSGSQLSSVFC